MKDGIPVGTSVEENVGVARSSAGAVTAGVTVGKLLLEPTGVWEVERCGGVRQKFKKRLPRTNKTNAPHPKPPKSRTSNVERYFLRDSIEVANLSSLLFILRTPSRLPIGTRITRQTQ